MKTIQNILQKHISIDVTVWIFGSRAKGNNRPYSDVDLAIKGSEKIPHTTMVSMVIDFEESDLPWTVDVIDIHATSQSFLDIIDKEKILLPLD